MDKSLSHYPLTGRTQHRVLGVVGAPEQGMRRITARVNEKDSRSPDQSTV